MYCNECVHTYCNACVHTRFVIMYMYVHTHVAFLPLDLYLIHTHMMHESTIHASSIPATGAHTNTSSLDTDALSAAAVINMETEHSTHNKLYCVHFAELASTLATLINDQ